MAQIDNPRKGFNFSIQIATLPINPWLCQEVTIPEAAVEVAEHGDTNHDIKTGGRMKYTNVLLDKLMTTDGPDNYFFDWINSVADVIIGGGLPPQAYKRIITISELAEDGATIINTWILTGAWPCKINGQKLSRQSSDNSIESIELCVDKVQKV